MKCVVSTLGRFHSFNLARELDSHDILEVIFTGYPRRLIRREGLPDSRVRCFPWLQAPFMAAGRFSLPKPLKRSWSRASMHTLDAHVARSLPECDVFVGLSGVGLRSGKVVQSRGGIHICDRGSTHIRFQDRIIREERAKLGLANEVVVDPRSVEREMAEYEQADLITVPSTFALESFIAEGVQEEKLRLVPYGVDLSRFAPTEQPSEESFDVLYAGSVNVRKGIVYLLEAFRNLDHPNKTLTIVGGVDPTMAPFIDAEVARTPGIHVVGHRPQLELARIMSRSHVMVLPSIEEGLALVQGQALASGCPVVGTPNSGAADLISDEVEGYIVPIRDPRSILDRLQFLADHPGQQKKMRQAALARVADLGGWQDYGERFIQTFC